MTPPDPEPLDAVPGLDPTASRRWFSLSRAHGAWLHEEVATRMAERLQWLRSPPQSWLNWEPVLGGLKGHGQLRQRLPGAQVHVWSQDPEAAVIATREPAAPGWNPLRRQRWLQALPARETTQVQMLWSNMTLHAHAHPQALIRRWHAHVATGGFLMFSCLGPDSLRELRGVYQRHGWPAPMHDFTDMHDWGDMLVRAGFAEPVMDMERIVLTYGSAAALVAELRTLGRNLSSARFGACRSRAWRDQLIDSIERDGQRGPDGRLMLSFEIVYGHAFKAAPRAPGDATSTVPLDAVRQQLRQRRR